MDVCSPFSFRVVTQEAIQLRLFPFFLSREVVRWLAELLQDSIISWEELLDVFLERSFPPLKMVKLRKSIENFNRVDGEPLHEMWLRFQKLLLQCRNHGVPDHLLIQYFYASLDAVNKGIVNKLVRRSILKEMFAATSALLDDMMKINQAWYTRDASCPLCQPSTEQSTMIKKEMRLWPSWL